MSNFELIDDYLTNRLNEQDKASFEKQLESDATLKSDVQLQKDILQGVKKARMVELKAMLNNVPISGGFTSGVTAGKLAASIIAVGVIGTSLYFYLKSDNSAPQNESSATVTIKTEPKDSLTHIAETPENGSTTPTTETAASTKDSGKGANTIARKKVEASTPDAQPKKIDVIDPSDELVDNSKESAKTQTDASGLTASKIAVETRTDNKKYNFNYQFSEGKLVLYGPFDKSLYEILEIHGQQNTVFLYYKDNYYLLNEKQESISILTPIKDPALIRKLKEYRSK